MPRQIMLLSSAVFVIRLDGVKAADLPETIYNWNFTDTKQQYALTLRNRALTYRSGGLAPNPDVSIELSRATLDEISLGATTLDKALAAGNIRITGDKAKLASVMGEMDNFPLMLNIVTP